MRTILSRPERNAPTTRRAITGEVMNRLLAAMNAHDLDAFVDCFAPGYRSEQPSHPSRLFDGSHQVRENWRSVFAGVPDFRGELIMSSDAGDVEIGEWRWSGTHVDGSPFAMCGVTVMGIEDGRVVWGRMYMEPVDRDDVDIDQMVRETYRPPQ
jgi:ketosteroid isomerase-like protein